MKEINRQESEKLISILNVEINRKCNELKQENVENKLKNIFFIGCILGFIIFVSELIFNLFGTGYILNFIVYQSIILILLMPFILRVMKGVTSK